MVQSPLGRREPTWIDPAWSAVKVASHLRTWDAVVPLAKVYSVVMVSASWTWSAVGTTERTPFSTTERVVPVAELVTVRVSPLERIRNARSVVAGVGSTMSIDPLTVTVCPSPVNVQPVKSTRTESGTGSPSELVGGDGLRVGMQVADDGASAGAPGIGAKANGMPVAASSVAPPTSEAASVATTSATALASGCVRTGFWGDVVGEVEHAANSATVTVPAAIRQGLGVIRRMRRSSEGFEYGGLLRKRRLDGRLGAGVKGVQSSASGRIKTAEPGAKSRKRCRCGRCDAAHTPPPSRSPSTP